MTTRLLRLGAGVFFLSAMTAITFAKDAPTSAEQLRSELESAIKAKDTNAIISLFNLQGVSARMKSQPSMLAAGMVYDGVASVKLSPLPAGIELTNELNGVRYYPNVRVVGVIDVAGIKSGNGTQLPYGESAGRFYLPGILEQTFDAKAPHEKGLTICFVGLFPDKPEIFNGSYVYLKGGKEITQNVCFTNSMNYAFFGDSVSSCQFKKSSNEGAMQLQITEDGKNIFDSGMIENTNAISYEKK